MINPSQERRHDEGPVFEKSMDGLGRRLGGLPLTLLNVAMGAMKKALSALRQGEPVGHVMDFEALKRILGFDAHDAELSRYRID